MTLSKRRSRMVAGRFSLPCMGRSIAGSGNGSGPSQWQKWTLIKPEVKCVAWLLVEGPVYGCPYGVIAWPGHWLHSWQSLHTVCQVSQQWRLGRGPVNNYTVHCNTPAKSNHLLPSILVINTYVAKADRNCLNYFWLTLAKEERDCVQ